MLIKVSPPTKNKNLHKLQDGCWRTNQPSQFIPNPKPTNKQKNFKPIKPSIENKSNVCQHELSSQRNDHFCFATLELQKHATIKLPVTVSLNLFLMHQHWAELSGKPLTAAPLYYKAVKMGTLDTVLSYIQPTQNRCMHAKAFSQLAFIQKHEEPISHGNRNLRNTETK